MGEQRKGGPGSKTRSGCITCKARRVKCDEKKPTCMRCRHMRLECDGYITKQKSQDAVKRLPPLVPKTSIITATVVPLTQSIRQNSFTNDLEFRYFRVFCETTAPNLGEYLDKNLWNHIILQASEQESFIKHAVIALGALNKTLDDTTDNANISGRASSEHYQAAFQLYGKSIRGIRKACEAKRRTRREILVACLLAICFEYFYGNVQLAIAHIKNGLRLIDEWFWSIRHRTSIGKQEFLPGIIEDELISIFSRLEVDISAWHEAKPITMHPDLEKLAMQIIQAIPAQGFANLDSARKYFDIMSRQVDWFVWSVNDELWTISENTIVSRKVTQVDETTSGIHSSKYQQDRANTLKQRLLRWHWAFQPLLAQSLKRGGNDSLVAKSLFLHFTCSTIALTCCFDSELSYDARTHQFRAALSVAESLSAAISSKARLTFIISSILIRSLYFIAMKCRHMGVRREAITCLQSMSRREGIWDSRVASTVATVVMKLEEADRNGVVPEHKRLRAVKSSFDLHKREGKLRYLIRSTESGSAGFVVCHVDLSW